MLKILVTIVIVLAAWPREASAQSVHAVLSAVDLLGTWSVRCVQPAAPDNQRMTFSAPAKGYGTLHQDFGNGHAAATIIIRRATDLSTTKVHLHEYQPDENAIIDTIIERSDGKIRVFWSRDSESGKVFVHDGVTVATGAAETWLSPCK